MTDFVIVKKPDSGAIENILNDKEALRLDISNRFEKINLEYPRANVFGETQLKKDNNSIIVLDQIGNPNIYIIKIDINGKEGDPITYRDNIRSGIEIKVLKPERIAALISFKIMPEYQNRGIGTKLIWTIEEMLKDYNTRSIIIPDNGHIYIGFFKKKGYNLANPHEKRLVKYFE